MLIAVSGASGSGKTTFCEYLADEKPRVTILSLDRYFKGRKQQLEEFGFYDFDIPESIDADLLFKNLNEFKEEGQASVPIYDFKKSERTGFEILNGERIIVVEGILSVLILKKIANISVFVETDLDLSLIRRIKRDVIERGRSVDDILDQYLESVRPSYIKYSHAIKDKVDFIISNNGDSINLSKRAKEFWEKINTFSLGGI